MAKIKIAGDAIVIESKFTLEDILALEKYDKKALSLYEKDEGTGKISKDFRVATTEGAGSLSQYGASFDSATRDEHGYACITMLLPPYIDDAKDYVAEELGSAFAKLVKVEEQIPAALAKVEQQKVDTLAAITMV